MTTIEVIIEGTKPILLHNGESMQRQNSGKKKIPLPEDEARASAYWTEDGSSLAFPAAGIHKAMITVSPNYKQGKQSITAFVAGSIEITPELIPFGTKKYEIDLRRAVVQRQAIRRARPKLFPWRLKFKILVDDDFPPNQIAILEEILNEAGRRVGIGDYRPEKRGRFGKFKVILFKVLPAKREKG